MQDENYLEFIAILKALFGKPFVERLLSDPCQQIEIQRLSAFYSEGHAEKIKTHPKDANLAIEWTPFQKTFTAAEQRLVEIMLAHCDDLEAIEYYMRFSKTSTLLTQKFKFAMAIAETSSAFRNQMINNKQSWHRGITAIGWVCCRSLVKLIRGWLIFRIQIIPLSRYRQLKKDGAT